MLEPKVICKLPESKHYYLPDKTYTYLSLFHPNPTMSEVTRTNLFHCISTTMHHSSIKILKHKMALLLYESLQNIFRGEREDKHLGYHLIQNPSFSSEETARRKNSKGHTAGLEAEWDQGQHRALLLSRHLNQNKSWSRWELELMMLYTSY